MLDWERAHYADPTCGTCGTCARNLGIGRNLGDIGEAERVEAARYHEERVHHTQVASLSRTGPERLWGDHGVQLTHCQLKNSLKKAPQNWPLLWCESAVAWQKGSRNWRVSKCLVYYIEGK